MFAAPLVRKYAHRGRSGDNRQTEAAVRAAGLCEEPGRPAVQGPRASQNHPPSRLRDSCVPASVCLSPQPDGKLLNNTNS